MPAIKEMRSIFEGRLSGFPRNREALFKLCNSKKVVSGAKTVPETTQIKFKVITTVVME